jgi:hypothetical protein
MQGTGSYHQSAADLGHGAHALTCDCSLTEALCVHFPPTAPPPSLTTFQPLLWTFTRIPYTLYISGYDNKDDVR